MDVPLLQLDDVGKSFASVAGAPPVVVLRGVGLTVDAGDAVAIIGPSGCGKSTLLNVIGGLVAPTSGTVSFRGESLYDRSDDDLAAFRNRSVGFVFQAHHLLPQLTALENVLIPTLAGRNGAARGSVEGRARDLLARVGLADRATHRPAQLSGGECQRVAVVRALINEPDLLLADEPTGALDEVAADGLADLLIELNAERAVTVIMVTHDLDLAGRMKRRLRLRPGGLEPVAAGAGSAT